MSSSGQAPNVSMDDLLASIKNMIEGESNSGANSPMSSNSPMDSQGEGGMSAQGAAPMNSGNSVNSAGQLDDGIMDLTQVVRPDAGQQFSQTEQHSQQGQGQQLQGQPVQQQAMGRAGDGGLNMGGTAQDAAAELNSLFNDFGNDHSTAQNMMGGGGDIGLPADAGSDFGIGADDFASVGGSTDGMGDLGIDGMMGEMAGADFGAPRHNPTGEMMMADGAMDQMSRDGLFGGAMSGQQMGGQNVDAQANVSQPNLGHAQNPGLAQAPAQNFGSPQGQQNQSQLNQGQLNQGPGNQGLGNRGLAGPAPAPHSPAPQNAQLGAGFGQVGNMGGMNPQQGGMGQNPNVQNPAALGQGGGQSMVPQGQNPQGQNPQGQVPLGQQAMGQMSNHGQFNAQNSVQPQGSQPLNQSGVQAGQHGGEVQRQNESMGGHDPRLESEIAMGQALSQADASLNLSAMQPQNQMLAQQQEQMRQMQHQQLPAASNGDSLPVLSGFRPVLPAVQEAPYGNSGGQMGGMSSSDMLPVEMRNNLEEIVKQLLKPLLREWLERNLPELLKGAVDEESGKIDPNRW